VAHYKFERIAPNSPLYEMTDSSGNGHHGAVVGQELFELSPDVPVYAGVTGEALDLRGRLDYAVIPHHADFAPRADWTIEFFIKVEFRWISRRDSFLGRGAGYGKFCGEFRPADLPADHSGSLHGV